MRSSVTIDAVITWVDGDDPRHIAKREQYGSGKILRADDVAGNTRFNSLGEIFYCVASINRFAPWINKIYIVTDEQDPHLEEFLAKYFPEGHIPVEIVDHKVIFRGYEHCLPTFNSISIESMTWRIPGLSDHFIEFNDDLILAAPVSPEDFFTEDGVVCYGKWHSSLLVRLSRLLKYRFDGSKKVTYKETMCNGAALAGSPARFIMMHHTPKALLKPLYEEFFTQHPESLQENIRHRFRCAGQYNPQEMHYVTLAQHGRCQMRSVEDNLLYLKPKPDVEYVKSKLGGFTRKAGYKFGCFNSLDQTSEQGLKMIIEWIERRIGLKD